jgi:3-oxoacyl-[acyl-carrier-protein] synthase-3
MGVKIDMIAVSRPWAGFQTGNSIKLSAKAASRCLSYAGIDPRDLGLLINTGIYRFKNIGEPSIAALIQKKIGDKKPLEEHPENTFSFDLNNGGCGWLTGIQLVRESINNGKISCGMVVTGDSEPFRGLSQGFKFEPAAAAIVLSESLGSGGFTLFRSYTFPGHNQELISCTYYDHLRWKRNGNNLLSVRQKESYPDLCVDFAMESLLNFLNESGFAFNDIDLIIPSQSPEGFVNKIRSRTGMNDKIIEVPKKGDRVLHTAGPAFALKKAWDDNRFRTSKRIIFLTVGSGINVSVALYEN